MADEEKNLNTAEEAQALAARAEAQAAEAAADAEKAEADAAKAETDAAKAEADAESVAADAAKAEAEAESIAADAAKAEAEAESVIAEAEKAAEVARPADPLAAEADAMSALPEAKPSDEAAHKQLLTDEGRKLKKTVLRIVAVVVLLAMAVGGGLYLLRKQSPILTGKTVMTVGGREVPADEYAYYLRYMMSGYESYYGDTYFDDAANFETLKEKCADYFTQQYALLGWAEDSGYALTDEEKAAVQTQIDDIAASYESEEAYAQALADSGITEELYYRLLCNDTLLTKFTDDLYDAEKSPYADAALDTSAYAAENGIYGAKHIFFLPGEDDAADAAVAANAEAILAKLEAGADFDTLMNTYSEDPGLASYPDGYTFAEGEMVDDFYAGTAALAVGEHSGVVKSDSGYHIILRVEPDEATVREMALSEAVYTAFNERTAAAKITYARGYDLIARSDFAQG